MDVYIYIHRNLVRQVTSSRQVPCCIHTTQKYHKYPVTLKQSSKKKQTKENMLQSIKVLQHHDVPSYTMVPPSSKIVKHPWVATGVPPCTPISPRDTCPISKSEMKEDFLPRNLGSASLKVPESWGHLQALVVSCFFVAQTYWEYAIKRQDTGEITPLKSFQLLQKIGSFLEEYLSWLFSLQQ